MAKPKKKTSRAPIAAHRAPKGVPLVRSFSFLLFVVFWALVAVIALTFPGYTWLSPVHLLWGYLLPQWVAIMILMVLMFVLARRFLKQKVQVSDWSPRIAFAGLILALGVGWVLGIHHFDKPPGSYWADPAYILGEVRQMKDLGSFQDTLIYGRQVLPVWPYTALGLNLIFPQLTGLAIQRLTDVLFYLLSIAVLFRLGQKIGGNRLGVLCALLTAVSKPLLFKVVAGYSYCMVPLFVGLILWTTLNLMESRAKRPFLIWGLILGVAAYTNYPIQPFIIFYIFAGLALMLWARRSEFVWPGAGVWISGAVFALYGVYCTGSLMVDNWLWVGTHPKQPIAALICLGLAAFMTALYLWKSSWMEKRSFYFRWAYGAWIAVFLSFPILTDVNYVQRIREHGFTQGSHYLSLDYLRVALGHLPETMTALFWSGMDRPDMALNADPYFSYVEMILLCLGVVLCLAKADLKRWLLLGAAVMGLVPHFFAASVHGGMLMCALAPSWVIAAIGLNEVFERATAWGRSRGFRSVLLALLAGLLIWTGITTYSRVHSQWADLPEGMMVLRDKVMKDESEGKRVYFSEYIFTEAADVVYEGVPFHFWLDANRIDIGPGEKTMAVVLYVNGIEGLKFQKRINSVFPKAQWQPVGTLMEDADVIKAFRCEISAEEILQKKDPLLSFHFNQGDFWKRTAGDFNHGMNFSPIAWQDAVTNPKALNPQGITAEHSEQNLLLEAEVHFPQGGRYELVCSTANRTQVTIDGKRVFDLTFPRVFHYESPGRTVKTTLELTPGDHSVQVATFFQADGLPQITFRRMVNGGEARSLWSGFSF